MILKIEVDVGSIDLDDDYLNAAINREFVRATLEAARHELKAEIQREVRKVLAPYKESLIRKAVKDACEKVLRPRGEVTE